MQEWNAFFACRVIHRPCPKEEYHIYTVVVSSSPIYLRDSSNNSSCCLFPSIIPPSKNKNLQASFPLKASDAQLLPYRLNPAAISFREKSISTFFSPSMGGYTSLTNLSVRSKTRS